MAPFARYKAMPNATAAEAIARALGQAYAASVGKPWPIPPDRYGGGRQPEPREAYYLEYYVRPVENLIPAPADAVALGGAQMNGHVLFEDLPQADKDKIDPKERVVDAIRSEVKR